MNCVSDQCVISATYLNEVVTRSHTCWSPANVNVNVAPSSLLTWWWEGGVSISIIGWTIQLLFYKITLISEIHLISDKIFTCIKVLLSAGNLIFYWKLSFGNFHTNDTANMFFRIKGPAWLPLCLLLPVLIIRTSSATSLCTPSSRPAVCSLLSLSEGSRCYTPRLPPTLMSPLLQHQAPTAVRSSTAAAGRDLSTERTSEPSCPHIRKKTLTPASETVDRRKMCRPVWKPSPHWRLPQRTLTETPFSECGW